MKGCSTPEWGRGQLSQPCPSEEGRPGRTLAARVDPGCPCAPRRRGRPGRTLELPAWSPEPWLVLAIGSAPEDSGSDSDDRGPGQERSLLSVCTRWPCAGDSCKHKALIRGGCQFPRCDYCHHGRFLAVTEGSVGQSSAFLWSPHREAGTTQSSGQRKVQWKRGSDWSLGHLFPLLLI